MAFYRVTAAELNLRGEPNKNTSVIARLPRHKILDQFDVSDDASWYHVRTTVMDGPPVAGWVHTSGVTPENVSIELASDAPWLAIAEQELGVTEVEGEEHNARILEYLATTPHVHQTDEELWCSAFVNWCIEKAGLHGTGNARARSWSTWGVPLDRSRQGCIAVLKRGPNPDDGHVGFYVDTKTGGELALLGGNQGNRVTVSTYPQERLVAWRWRA
jgi:uncharacterized protein (TIGR02594 family)